MKTLIAKSAIGLLAAGTIIGNAGVASAHSLSTVKATVEQSATSQKNVGSNVQSGSNIQSGANVQSGSQTVGGGADATISGANQ